MKKIKLFQSIIFTVLFITLITDSFCQSSGKLKWIFPDPQGNAINKIIFTSPDTAYLISEYQNFSRSYDGGNTWATTFDENFSLPIGGMSFLNNNTGFIFTLDLTTGNQVALKTNDAGTTWNTAYLGSPAGGPVYYEAIFFDNNNGIVANSNGEVYKTQNGGTSWNIVPNPGIKFLSRIDNLSAYAADNMTVIQTTDAGQNWQQVGTLPAAAQALSFGDMQNGYCIVNNTLYKTVNGGVTWNPVAAGPYMYHTVSMYDANNIIAAGYGGTSYSSDGGFSWNNYNTNGGSYIYASSAYAPGVGVTTGSFGNIYKTADSGITWTDISKQIGSATNIQINSAGYGAVGGGKVAFTDDNGANWYFTPTQITSAAAWRLSATTAFSVNNGGLSRTVDGGNTWTLVQNITPYNFRSIYFADNLTGYACDDIGRIVKTTDGGNNWFDHNLNTKSFESIRFLDAQFGYGWDKISGSGYSITTDGGATWQPVSIPSAASVEAVWHFSPDTALVADAVLNHILYTTDGGASWSITGTCTYYHGNFFFTDKDTGFFSNTDYLIKTVDGGLTWNNVTRYPMPIPEFFGMYFTDGDHGFIGAWQGALFGYNGTGTTPLSIEEEPNAGNIKMGVFPNPVTDQLHINLEIQDEPEATLKLYGINGTFIKTLFVAKPGKSAYNTIVNLDKLPKGIYFLRLNTGSGITIKKLVKM